MLRIRVAVMLGAAVALMAASCGDGGDAAQQQPEAVAPVTTEAGPDDPAEGDAATTSTAAPAQTGDPDEDTPAADGAGEVPVDAAGLLSSAATTLEGRSVRGEATVELAPGFELSSTFESDVDGDLAATVELPPGFDPQFGAGADAEVRYVAGMVYVRPPVTAETLAALGLDEAWHTGGRAAGDDPMSMDMGSAGGVICVFPQMQEAPTGDCDPLGEMGTLLEAASEPEIAGRKDVRGEETTGVRFRVSLMDLAGEALGMVPDDGEASTSEDGVFDDSASDPFAEGLDQIFGFLADAGFEVEAWIDGDGLIRRLAFDLNSIFAGLGGTGEQMPSSLITLEFYDYDADISVDAPPPEAIVDEGILAGDDAYATSEQSGP